LFNLEAHAETVSLLRPFFPADWGELPKGISKFDSTYVAHFAAIALDACSEPKASLAAYGAVMRADIASGIDSNSVTTLRRISHSLNAQNRLAQALRVDEFAKEIATLRDYRAESFMCQLNLFTDLSNLGRWEEASATWERLDPMGRDWSRVIYRAGMAEERYARFRFLQGTLQEEHLADAEGLAKNDNNRMSIRDLCRLRGSWSLEKGEWEKAEASFQEAVRLARERSLSDAEAETGLALAKQHLGQFADPYTEAERLALARKPAYRLLGRLWLACGNLEQARHCALAAYRWAWADGEPFVNRFELNKAAELLQQLDVPIPDLAFYDPAGDVSLPWEPDLCAAIESLRALPRDEIDEELK
jgi:tetratricopeptide (TPR) repeat protein